MTDTSRVRATLVRIISNAPRIRETLCECGRYNLALQFEHDVKNLKYWLDHGGLVPVKNEWEE